MQTLAARARRKKLIFKTFMQVKARRFFFRRFLSLLDARYNVRFRFYFHALICCWFVRFAPYIPKRRNFVKGNRAVTFCIFETETQNGSSAKRT
jgi:hypothetical protein